MNGVEKCWLAGLLEGEGTFRRTHSTLEVRIGMTDRDVIERAAKVMGGKATGPYHYPPRLPIWVASVWGPKALFVMRAVRSQMGERRRAKIDSLVSEWLHRERLPAGGWGRTRAKATTSCHPDRKHYAKGLCRACYVRSRRAS